MATIRSKGRAPARKTAARKTGGRPSAAKIARDNARVDKLVRKIESRTPIGRGSRGGKRVTGGSDGG